MAITRIGNIASTIPDDSIQNVKMSNIVQSKNIIINGDMSIAQRATSVSSITSDGYYTVDRFTTEIGSFGTWTQSQATDVPTGKGFATSLKMDCTTAQGSPGSSAVMLVGQSIEGQMLQYLCWGTSDAKQVTLSFWHKHTKTGTNIVELLESDNNDAVSGSYTQSVSDTWEKSTITFPAKTSGAIDNDNARSLRIRFIIGSGTDYTSGTLATTWQSSITNANRYVGQVNNADSTSNNFIITGVQLEAGTTASEFEFLPYDVNFNRCRRYYEKFDNSGDPDSEMYWIGIACADTNTDARTVLRYYPKRANPSTSFTGTVRVDPGNRTTTTMYFDTQRTQSSLFYYNSLSASGSASDALYMRFNTTSSKIELNSEL